MRTLETTLPRCPACGNEIEIPVPRTTGEGSIRCPKPYCGVELLAREPGQIAVHTFRLKNEYSLFVLPFSFDARTEAHVASRLEHSPRWKERRFSLDDERDADRTEYFLPYVKRFLFPSLYPAVDGSSPTCRHHEFDLVRLGGSAKDGLAISLHCRDSRKALDMEHRIVLEEIRLVVFSYRVAFLVFRVRCADGSATFFDQMNAAVYFRSIAPLYKGFEMPEFTAAGARFRMAQLLGFLLAEFTEEGNLPGDVASLPDRTPLPVRPIYDDRMMVYTWSCIAKETALPELDRNQSLLDRFALVELERPTLPLSEKVDSSPESWFRQRWQGFSKEGGCLAVFDTDRFHERFLGVYHGSYYFDIFLLATLQRVTLLSLFERLSDIQRLTRGGSESRRSLRRVRRDLLLFKNQCWFSQITNRERGLVLWKKWQEVFENRALLSEVNEQSQELDVYLQARTRERIDWLVRLGGFLATAVPGILGMNLLLGDRPWVSTLRWILLILLVVGTGVFALVVLSRVEE